MRKLANEELDRKTIEEFKSIWGASEYFDSFDILASGLGSALSILIFETITYTRKNKQ